MLTIDNTVSSLYSQAKMGILAMKNVDPSAPLDPVEVSETMAEIRRRYGHLDRAGLKALYPIRAYADYYRTFGYSYHVLAQLESVLKGKKQLRAPSGLLLSMFLSEIESMLLTAGHDLAALRTPLRLKLAAGGEVYRSISGKDVQTVKDDLMVCSGSDVVSSILRGPDSQSRITKTTTNVLFTVYAPHGIETEDIGTDLRNLERRIRSFSPASDTTVLHVYIP